ncbi:hypothetical protein SELMODRAFT_408283 [Selaginella moellendorffii]|uniref:Uncharacterized protein n=1 Tax=Selaginella moellendorffii TaxID=88036 RepID=D8R7T3_SELML|nr:hypothetical protein SELMODRAFT_408283 [Selaginella moellendorffii]
MADDATVAAVASRADRFSRIAKVVRRDLDCYAEADGLSALVVRGGTCASSSSSLQTLEPPWIARRRRREMAALDQERRESEHQASVRQVVEMAVGMGEQVDAMRRQLEEQNRQLKALTVGHCAQVSQYLQHFRFDSLKPLELIVTSIQQQLLDMLATVQTKQQRSKSPPRPAYIHTTHGQTPQEYHTLTWLHNNHRQAGKHYRHPAHGFRPLRRSSIHSDLHKYDSGSDRTRTTFGGTRRRGHRRSPPVSVPTEPAPESARSVEKARKPSPKKTKKVPLVALLYAKCKRRWQKQSARKREKTARQAATTSSAATQPKHNNAKCHRHRSRTEHHRPIIEERHEVLDLRNDNAKQLEDKILDSMLEVLKHEDELKQRWLVSDQDEGKDIGKSILDELMNEMAPRNPEKTMETISQTKEDLTMHRSIDNLVVTELQTKQEPTKIDSIMTEINLAERNRQGIEALAAQWGTTCKQGRSQGMKSTKNYLP